MSVKLIKAIRAAANEREALDLLEAAQSRPSSTQSAGVVEPATWTLTAWKPDPLESIPNCLRNSLKRAISLLMKTGHPGDAIDASRLLYQHDELATPPATSGMKEAEPTSMWANLRSVKAALTGELGVQVTPYLYAEKVAIDDVEFLIGKPVNQDGLVGDAERYRFLRENMVFTQEGDARCTMELNAPLPAVEHDIHKDFLAERFDRSVDKTVDAAIRAGGTGNV